MDRGKFELDQAKSKDKIAENSVALGHETHNSTLKPSIIRLNIHISLVAQGLMLSVIDTFLKRNPH